MNSPFTPNELKPDRSRQCDSRHPNLDVEELEAAIELIGVAWNLTPDAVTKSKEAITVEREATCAEEKEGTTHPAIYGGALPTAAETGDGIQPSDDDGDGVTAILWALLKTATRLDTQEKREQLFEIARFMADYMGPVEARL